MRTFLSNASFWSICGFFIAGSYFLVPGHWLLVAGRWFLGTGYRSLVGTEADPTPVPGSVSLVTRRKSAPGSGGKNRGKGPSYMVEGWR